MQIQDIELLKDQLKNFNEPCVKAIVMFGSRARGESKDRSDIDLLVLHENCNIEDMVIRRRYFYNILREAIGKEYEDITLIDMELKYFLKPYEINSLLLNIYYDSIAIYDKTGTIESFLKYVKNKIEESGLKRIKDGKAYYWILPKPLKEVKIL
ncbi:MAG: nucleotidyltransferase domain-containing protein [Nitrososphaerota archaeon]